MKLTRAGLAVVLLALVSCSPGAAQRTSRPSSAAPTTTSPPATVAPTTVTPTTAAPATTTTTTATTTFAATAGPPATLAAGQWRPVGPIVNGLPALSATLVGAVGVVRINRTVTRPVLYAGTAEPGGRWPNQGAVAPEKRSGLVAAFNGGFHTSSSGGGWFDHGSTAVPLRMGAASLVIWADGTATVGMWGRDATPTPEVVSVRQNLGLLVDAGASQGGSGYWGATLGGVRNTWRSGVGVNAEGDLLYVGGPGLDAQSLAQVFIAAGAVRAMELDINPQWVSFSYYTGPAAGANLIPGMSFGPRHWLDGSARDFFVVMAR